MNHMPNYLVVTFLCFIAISCKDPIVKNKASEGRLASMSIKSLTVKDLPWNAEYKAKPDAELVVIAGNLDLSFALDIKTNVEACKSSEFSGLIPFANSSIDRKVLRTCEYQIGLSLVSKASGETPVVFLKASTPTTYKVPEGTEPPKLSISLCPTLESKEFFDLTKCQSSQADANPFVEVLEGDLAGTVLDVNTTTETNVFRLNIKSNYGFNFETSADLSKELSKEKNSLIFLDSNSNLSNLKGKPVTFSVIGDSPNFKLIFLSELRALPKLEEKTLEGQLMMDLGETTRTSFQGRLQLTPNAASIETIQIAWRGSEYKEDASIIIPKTGSPNQTLKSLNNKMVKMIALELVIKDRKIYYIKSIQEL